MSLDPGAQRLLRMLAAARQDAQARPSAAARREALRQLTALTADPIDASVATEDAVFPRGGANGPLPLRLYRHGDAQDGVIVYLHGGGWAAGDLETHDGVCRALALHSGCTVMAVDYRRAPEHPFPAAVEDAVDVVRWARRETGRLILAGDSAGANIAAAAVNRLGAEGPDLLVLLCPILDMAPSHPSRQAFAAGYFIDGAQFAADQADYLTDPALAADPSASPLRATDLGDHPPAYIHVAEFDPFRDEALAYAERLKAAGVRVEAVQHPGMIHYFYALPRAIPHARTALAEIGRAVRAFRP